jgi:hypothetical protein
MNWGKHPLRCTIDAGCARHNGQVPWPQVPWPAHQQKALLPAKAPDGIHSPFGNRTQDPKKAEKSRMFVALTRN